MRRSAKVLEEATHFVMVAHERKHHLMTRAPKQDALSEADAQFPQFRLELRQAESSRQLSSPKGADKQIHTTLDLKLLGRVVPLQASSEGRVEGVLHLQAPKVSESGVLGAEGSFAGSTLREAGQSCELLLRQPGIGDKARAGQDNSSAINDEADHAAFASEMKGLTDRLGQLERSIRPNINRTNFLHQGILRRQMITHKPISFHGLRQAKGAR